MSHVVILNQHTNNYGDDAAGSALIQSCIEMLHAETIDVHYIWHKAGGTVPGPRDVCNHHKMALLSGQRDNRARMVLVALRGMLSARLLPREFRELVDRCRRADVVYVSPAGSNVGIYKDWIYLLTLLVVVNAGVTPIFCQNTIAASNSRIFNRVARRVLGRSQLHVRERASQVYLRSLGIQSSLGVDTALLLTPVEASAPPSVDGHHGYLAVVPTRLGNWHRDHREFDDDKMLTERLAAAVASVSSARGLRVVLVPHLHGPEAEEDMFRLISDAVRANGAAVETATVGSLDDYRRLLAGAESVVSMRYHGLILAALAGVPCVALSYENKMLEAAAYLGLSDLTLDVRSASRDQILASLRSALDRSAPQIRHAKSQLDSVRLIAAGPLLEGAAHLVRRD